MATGLAILGANADGSTIVVTGTSNEAHGHLPIMPARAFPRGWGGNRIAIHSLRGGQANESWCMSEIQHNGDVGCMISTSHAGGVPSRFVSCSSRGRVRLFEPEASGDVLVPVLLGETSPLFRGGRLTCLDVDLASNSAAVVGENGLGATVSLDDPSSLAPCFTTPNRVGGLPLSGVAFQGMGGRTFATAGSATQAQLCLWDTRQGSCVVKCRHPRPVPYSCITNRPLAPEYFIAGTLEGEIAVWDVRSPKEPQVCLRANEEGNPVLGGNFKGSSGRGPYRSDQCINGLICHQERPQFFMTCGEDGRVLLWDMYGGQPAVTCHCLGDTRGQILTAVTYDSAENMVYSLTIHGQLLAYENLQRCRV